MNIFRNLFADARMEIVNIRHARNHVIINGEIMDRNKIFGALPDSARWRNLIAARLKTTRIISPVINTAEIGRKHTWGWRREVLPTRARGRARDAWLPRHGRI